MARRPRRKAPPEPTNLERIAEYLARELQERWEALDGTEQAAMFDAALDWNLDTWAQNRAYFWTTNEGREDLQAAVGLAVFESGTWSELSKWVDSE